MFQYITKSSLFYFKEVFTGTWTCKINTNSLFSSLFQPFVLDAVYECSESQTNCLSSGPLSDNKCAVAVGNLARNR